MTIWQLEEYIITTMLFTLSFILLLLLLLNSMHRGKRSGWKGAEWNVAQENSAT